VENIKKIIKEKINSEIWVHGFCTLWADTSKFQNTDSFFYGKSQDGFTRGKKNGLVHRDRILKQMYKYIFPASGGAKYAIPAPDRKQE
jgi:hypothetical protein